MSGLNNRHIFTFSQFWRLMSDQGIDWFGFLRSLLIDDHYVLIWSLLMHPGDQSDWVKSCFNSLNLITSLKMLFPYRHSEFFVVRASIYEFEEADSICPMASFCLQGLWFQQQNMSEVAFLEFPGLETTSQAAPWVSCELAACMSPPGTTGLGWMCPHSDQSAMEVFWASLYITASLPSAI